MNILNGVSLEDTLINLEKVKLNLLNQVEISTFRNIKHEEQGHQELKKAILSITNPLKYKDFDLYFFKYEGSMPLYKKNDSEYVRLMQHYYNVATNRQCVSDSPPFSEQVCICIEHYFTDTNIRDIDNRNRKFVIDAIRYNQVLDDDTMQKMVLFERGFENSETNCQKVYVFPMEMLTDYIQESAALKELLIEEEKKRDEAIKDIYRIITGNAPKK